MLGMGATGVAFDDVEVTVSDQFKELYPDRKLPLLARLKPEGRAGRGDVGAVAYGTLVVSQPAPIRAGALASPTRVKPFEGETTDQVVARGGIFQFRRRHGELATTAKSTRVISSRTGRIMPRFRRGASPC